jgi:hypothetical protein
MQSYVYMQVLGFEYRLGNSRSRSSAKGSCMKLFSVLIFLHVSRLAKKSFVQGNINRHFLRFWENAEQP